MDLKIKELYYYTSVQTMQFILQNADIYATNLQYMNDSEEYANGLKEVREIYTDSKGKQMISKKQLQDGLNKEINIYSISFSAARDLLSQWSMYAGESGVSLKLNFTGLEKYRACLEEDGTRGYIHEQRVFPQKIFYCTKDLMKAPDYQKVKKDILDEIEKNEKLSTKKDPEYAPYIWENTAPYVKRLEFRAEQEYRLVFNWPLLLHKVRIDYRNDRNVLKPYLDIECEGGWPIEEIVVGPGFNQDVVFNSIVHFLSHRKLKLPELPEKEYLKRAEKYLMSCGKLSDKVKNFWNEEIRKGVFSDYKTRDQAIQRIFTEIKGMLKNNSMIKREMENTFFSKDGIILSKSRIPYIYS